ncbi:hypothetical protein H9P43_004219 [Blastocladiella emersonii ATCC 22665]|nr:hypothetical protein H9P43_004219 [Blastocladiella emersonii ATCC 22665]
MDISTASIDASSSSSVATGSHHHHESGELLSAAGSASASASRASLASAEDPAPHSATASISQSLVGLASTPPYLEKWLVSLQTSFAADYLLLKRDLDRAHRATLDRERAAHTASLTAVETAIKDLQADAAQFEATSKWRLHALGALARQFRLRALARTRAQLFLAWRRKTFDAHGEAFKHHVATTHAARARLRKAMAAWAVAVRGSWKRMCERKAAAKAQETIDAAKAEYERKIDELTAELAEQVRLHQETEALRQAQEHDLRSAFMRGLSALNMETMSALNHSYVVIAPQRGSRYADPSAPTPASMAASMGGVHLGHGESYAHVSVGPPVMARPGGLATCHPHHHDEDDPHGRLSVSALDPAPRDSSLAASMRSLKGNGSGHAPSTASLYTSSRTAPTRSSAPPPTPPPRVVHDPTIKPRSGDQQVAPGPAPRSIKYAATGVLPGQAAARGITTAVYVTRHPRPAGSTSVLGGKGRLGRSERSE